MATEKAIRKQRKAAITRELNSVKRYIAEEDEDEIKGRLHKLKTAFVDFEASHEAYHKTLTEEKEQDESDQYLYDVQDSYINGVMEAKKWLKSLIVPVKQAPMKQDPDVHANTADSDLKRHELMSLINMPKVEIKPFDGDPLKFHSFMALFNESVDKATDNDQMKLTRLLQYTVGKAGAAIESCVLIGGEQGYKQALEILETRFGNHHLVSERIIKGVRYGNSVRTPEGLQQLSDELQNCEATLKQMKMFKEVDNQQTLKDIVSRMQPHIRTKWKRHAVDSKRNHDVYPGFHDLVIFVKEMAEEANDPVYGQFNIKSHPNDDTRSSKHKGPPPISAFTNNVKPGSSKKACILCAADHRLIFCPKFKEMSIDERRKIVVNNKLCEICLIAGHFKRTCKSPYVCTVPNCNKRHSRLIHVDIYDNTKPDSIADSGESEKVDAMSIYVKKSDCIYLPIVQVNVNGKCNAYALLDTGSTHSFCSNYLVDALGIGGSIVDYQLSTFGQEGVPMRSRGVNLRLQSTDGGEKLDLSGVYVVNGIPVLQQPLSGHNHEKYSHLKDISGPLTCGKVDLLIGQDNAEALVPLETRRGKRGEPFAIWTLFGWCINGPQERATSVNQRVISNFVTTANIEETVNKLWNIENEGTSRDILSWSQEDRRVINLWDTKCRLINGRYELPIPWKDEEAEIPNNLSVALSRLQGLKKSLIKKNLTSRYNDEIMKLLESGYAEEVSDGDTCQSDRIWYLPHHAVINEKKPEKVRVVFDCSARYMGESLNDKCLQGPDLINKLLHVLLRFRENNYAIMADIEAMYHQVKIPVYDRNVLRFLWYGDKGQVKHYRMTSHLFGGIWCASSSTYALRRTVQDNEDVGALVRNTVMKSFYVDDCLTSVRTREEAREIIHGTSQLLKKGGFRLTKFVTNDVEVLKEVPEVEKAKEVKDLHPEANSKTLGIKWNVTTDDFYFEVKKFDDKTQITRRCMLSFVSSMFDPLGLISPVLVIGKLLFQEATRMKLPWDEEVPRDLHDRWKRWLETLLHLSSLRIPRCLKPGEYDDAVLELHHFSDASEKAYGCSSYLRCINRVGCIHTSLIISKNRVAPLKQTTIPRLELQAALLSAKIDAMLRDELGLDLTYSYFWTDSEIVLRYIKNETSRFRIFVGNRVATIRSLTKPSQWNHVSGAENPADILSRGQTVGYLNKDLWFQGPEFLKAYKGQWRTWDDLIGPDSLKLDPEVKREQQTKDESRKVLSIKQATSYKTEVHDVRDEMIHPIDVLLNHFSSWHKLKRAMCWLNRVKDHLLGRDKPHESHLSVDEMKYAEVNILKYVQENYYKKEIKRIRKSEAIQKSSSLRKLSPTLGKDGLLRVGGRLKHAELELVERNPCIIPHLDRTAQLIIQDVHNIAHSGCEWVLSLVRRRFWITKARRIIKGVSRKCLTCRKLFASPSQQMMSDLPPERCQPDRPPFSFVGLDCFGPFYVKQGRSEVKRYGCLFTCLSTRAVHIEKLDGLDTDTFLNGFIRFSSRRGWPEKVFSDNVTNFTGGKSELSKSLKMLDKEKIHHYCSRKEVNWSFNPPSASHMGGIWERMIRSIRKVLTALLSDKCRLTDDVLETLFCEAESIVNGRPPTKVSDDIHDSAALTPNHILLLRGNPSLSLGKFVAGDMYRRRWRYVQYLVDQFWRKWTKEYLPELQKRHKWTIKKRNVQVGDLVLIMDENTPRGIWPLGLVTEVHKGRDQLVRSVKIRTKVTQIVRPITKIILLEGSEFRYTQD